MADPIVNADKTPVTDVAAAPVPIPAAPAVKAAVAPKAEAVPAPQPAAKKVEPAAKVEAPVAKPAAAPAPAAKAAPKVSKTKPVTKTQPATKRKPVAATKSPAVTKKAMPRPVPAFAQAASVSELKEMIMATKTTTTFPGALPSFPVDITDISKSMTEAVSEMQTKAQEAYDKSTGMVAEMTELAKGHVEAIVESSKIMAAGIQDLGKTYAEEAKSAYETMTADVKEMAAVKSPTELFQLQGKILRRNFDLFVASGSKGSESALKLANDTFAPLSARVNLAVEKLSKAA